MTDAEILARLTDLFRSEFADRGLVLSPCTGPADLAGWDSVRMLDVIFRIEQEFGLAFTGAEIDRFRNVQDFIEAIAARRRG
ncbi:MAG: acyl carrier protein [Acidisphaera sp.]|nr:acyl carrier protein [Acidisphaera sp.]